MSTRSIAKNTESSPAENHLAAASSFRRRLQNELISRIERNSNYSLRAFAKSLEIAPSALSAMINGKRKITNASIQKLGLALDLPLMEIEAYLRAELKTSASVKTIRFGLLDQDQFAVIADWYHYTLLELMKVRSFEGTPQWIARALGISRIEAATAIERLVRLNLIKIENTKWTDLSEGYSTNFDKALVSKAMRKMQMQIAGQSLTALEKVPFGERVHASMTMAIDPADIPEATKMILEFQKDLCAFLERKAKPKDVYHLSIGLFPATQLRTLEKN